MILHLLTIFVTEYLSAQTRTFLCLLFLGMTFPVAFLAAGSLYVLPSCPVENKVVMKITARLKEI